MIRRRSSGEKLDQDAISSIVRPHPSHKRVRGSMTQTLMQGVSMRAPHSVIDRVEIGLQPW
jgi:hypothetical protein